MACSVLYLTSPTRLTGYREVMAGIQEESYAQPDSAAAPYRLAVPREMLSELSRATTAYYEATPDRLEQAQREYEEALRKFNGAC